MHYLRKSLIFCFFTLLVEFSMGKDTLSTGQTLKDGAILTSAKGSFALGFFSPGMSQNRYLAIYFSNLREKRVVWVANRGKPVNNIYGVLSFHTPNNLVLHGSDLKVPIWSTGFLGLGKNYSAQLLDTGNLVVFDEDKKGIISWQSFDHPTNIWLPEMKLGVNRKTGLNWSLRSWTSEDDPGTGENSVRMDVLREFSELSLYRGSNKVWRSGPLKGSRLGKLSMYIFNVTYVDNEDVVYMTYSIREPSPFSIIMVTHNGFIRIMERNPDTLNWSVVWTLPTGECDYYNDCGPNKYCATSKTEIVGQCYCFPGFESKVIAKSAGCVRKRDRNVCRNGEGFLKFSSMLMPEIITAHVVTSDQGLKECREECLRDCNCTAYVNATEMGIACVMWHGNLFDTRKYKSGGRDLYVRVDAVELEKTREKRHPSSSKAAVVPISVGVVVGFIAIFILYWRRHKRKGGLRSTEEQGPANNWTKEVFDANEINGNIQFIDLITIVEATNNFCDQNKLGKGGFGTVYKGTLKDGYVIAVKRLSETSQQGVVEFKNEATLVSRLRHVNLVRLLGCCAEQKEKILIYEYMPNKSLDSLIFHPENSSRLNWEQRFNIIMGITRGMMYLHADSRGTIVHRDLKVSNILLDAQMNPKVSDFGMARFFDNNEVEAITRTVVGTYGYMAPEYIETGTYSTKSDVYSFGVLLLEIISGRKNNTYINKEMMNLISLAWYLGERALEIVDSSMGDYPANTVQRCIHVGLSCVQLLPDHRPTMSEIFVMLSSEQIDLPTLHPPRIVHYPPTHEHSSSSDYTLSSDYTSSYADYTASSSNVSRNDLTCSEIIPR